MAEQVTLKAWGNSYGIRIPKKILEMMKLKPDDVMTIEAEGDSIRLHKTFRHKSFEERLAEYNGEISVEMFDWGQPEGREFF